MCLTKSETNLIRALYDYNKIPLWILSSDYSLCCSFFTDTASDATQALCSYITSLACKLNSKKLEILCYENELYYLFPFRRENKQYYLAGGPMLLNSLYHCTFPTSLSFASYMTPDKLKITAEVLPIVSLSSFTACLRIMLFLLSDHPLTINEIRNYESSTMKGSLNHNLVHELFENAEEFRLHTPYREELALLTCVKEGNLKKLEDTYLALPQTRYGKMSNNPLRQLFYGCIANTTLVARFAIEGGMDEEAAFTLSDVYIQQMDHCHTLYELNMLNEKMAADFTTQVAKANKKESYSAPIKNSIRYILDHLHEPFSLSTLAKEVHLTPKYLSSRFKKETSLTITSYIERERIKEAKDLLSYSTLSYGQIAHSLCFNSQSYFIKIFKKHTGMTPKTYREHLITPL